MKVLAVVTLLVAALAGLIGVIVGTSWTIIALLEGQFSLAASCALGLQAAGLWTAGTIYALRQL